MNYRRKLDDIIELSTGLKDINGIEIFENDLVTFWYEGHHFGGTLAYPVQIRFYRGRFIFAPFIKDETKREHPIFYQDMFLGCSSDNYFIKKFGEMPNDIELFESMAANYAEEDKKRIAEFNKYHEEWKKESVSFITPSNKSGILFGLFALVFIFLLAVAAAFTACK